MAIPAEDIARVRAATDIAALIGERTSLRRSGTRQMGLCPFHQEKTPSFYVNTEEGLYHCFGCGASGDAISFLQATEGCDFVEAVERLAARAGMTVRNDADRAGGEARGHRPAIYEALREAADFYHERLLHDAAAGHARHYLRSRGYDGSVVRQYHLGYAPAGWDELARALHLSNQISSDTGLVFLNSRGRLQDAFRDRVMFPIFDPGDRVIAFGGRVLPDELRSAKGPPGPKYRNSPESPVYQKRATLYGLNWAKVEMATTNEAIVCEGYTDVIGFHQAGLHRAVATCGTALTEDHFKVLARFAKRVVLCFDADAAGDNAAARLYEWERRHELELRVAALPKGADPAELARDDPEALRSAIGAAPPYLAFLLERVLSGADLTSPEGRARAAGEALGVIAAHPSELVREEYLLKISDRTRHDLERLRTLLQSERTRSDRPPARPAGRSGDEAARGAEGYDEPPPRDEEGTEGSDAGPAPRRPARESLEQRAGRDALLLAIERPGEVAGRLHEVLFCDPVQREAFRALSVAEELHEAIDQAPASVADLLRRLAVSGNAAELDLEGTIVELVRVGATAALTDVEREERLAGGVEDPARFAAINETTRMLKAELEALRDPIVVDGRPSAASEAAERLLAWLTNREP